jgi:hypothetical protein
MRASHGLLGTVALAFSTSCAFGVETPPEKGALHEMGGEPATSGAGGSSIVGNPSTTGGVPRTPNDDAGRSANEDAAPTTDAHELPQDTTGPRVDGGAVVTLPPPVPCTAGSVIEAVSTGMYYSWPGTVYASTPITGEGGNHQPKKLEVRVTKAGQPVSGCEVRWIAAGDNGWGFSADPKTDANGRLYGYWTAGKVGPGKIAATIALEGGGESHVEFNGTVASQDSRTDSVHLNYDVDGSYTELKVQVTPLTNPAATYYSALNWQDAYAGIQFDRNAAGQLTMSMVIFSVWDAGGAQAAVTDHGACNSVLGFGGEGTGTSCRLRFPPNAQNGAVAGLPSDYMLKVGDTYELHLTMRASGSGTAHTLTFRDVTNNIGPISLGTQTTGTSFQGGRYASSFVEEWTPHGSCLSAGRSVYYHDLQALVGNIWRPIKTAHFDPNYIASNNEICGNYLATVANGMFFMSSGGSDYVGRPYVPNDAKFPKTQPALTLP